MPRIPFQIGQIVRCVESNAFVTKDQIYKVKSKHRCDVCGDDLIELWGFEGNPSECRFCKTLSSKTYFSTTRFM